MSPRAAAYNDLGKKIRPASRLKTLGRMNRRIVLEDTTAKPVFNSKLGRSVIATYEHSYHATKGWRTRRVTT